MIDPKNYSIAEAHAAMRSKKISAKEFVDLYLLEAKKANPEINAYLEIFDDIDQQVEIAQNLFDQGKEGPMTGIPFAIKDNMLMKGRITTGASKILAGHRSVYDATVIQKLRAQGAIILGRTNMDEFAMGSTTENSAYGVTKNPLDTSRVPGGSSGGSAAAVAMGGALVALGSDTGGSVRLPAAFCGLVGLKPTYGAVSRYGLMAMASSYDQIGPIGKTVEDVQAVFEAIRGEDQMDSTSIPKQFYKTAVPKQQLTIGVPREFIDVDGLDKEVKDQFEATLERYRALGHKVVDIKLPYLKYALPVYYIIVPAEVSANLARYDGIRYGHSHDGEVLRDVYFKSRAEGFGPEVRRRILLGTYVLSAGYYDAYYYKANSLREIIRDDFTRIFQEVDVIATPTAPTPAYKLGEKTSDPLAMYLGDVFTVTANVAGIPAMSLPMGTVMKEGKELPLGFQLLAAHMQEETLFTAAKIIEKK